MVSVFGFTEEEGEECDKEVEECFTVDVVGTVIINCSELELI